MAAAASGMLTDTTSGPTWYAALPHHQSAAALMSYVQLHDGICHSASLRVEHPISTANNITAAALLVRQLQFAARPAPHCMISPCMSVILLGTEHIVLPALQQYL
jgi:hypothetical protein